MIDTIQDWSALAAFGFLFGIAIAACAYYVGRERSYWQGYFAGVEKTRRRLIPRLIRARINARRAARRHPHRTEPPIQPTHLQGPGFQSSTMRSRPRKNPPK
ncbi:MAG TPA: hypothetical protein VGM54_02165 [Chthoniobacter sp.]|jgi:hypothetical protein